MKISDGIIFDQLPMPPSENEAYPTDFKTGRRFEGKELSEFKRRLQSWSLRRATLIAPLIEELKWELADHRKCLRVDSYFFFQYEKLFTKPVTSSEKPRRKKMDVSNKGKALYDCLGKMLGIDDSRIQPGEMVAVLRTDPQGMFVQCRLSYSMIETDLEFLQRPEVQQKI